jgi:hypothetical protein
MLVYDLNGLPHEKQPIDAKECVERLGWSYTATEKPAADPAVHKPAKKAAKVDDSDTTTG